MVCSNTLPSANLCPKVKGCPSEKSEVGMLIRSQVTSGTAQRGAGQSVARSPRVRLGITREVSVATVWGAGPDHTCEREKERMM